MFAANICIWIVSSLFTIPTSIVLLTIGMFIYLSVVPFIEAADVPDRQKVVPQTAERIRLCPKCGNGHLR